MGTGLAGVYNNIVFVTYGGVVRVFRHVAQLFWVSLCIRSILVFQTFSDIYVADEEPIIFFLKEFEEVMTFFLGRGNGKAIGKSKKGEHPFFREVKTPYRFLHWNNCSSASAVRTFDCLHLAALSHSRTPAAYAI